MNRNFNLHREALVTTAQAFTTGWVDIGAEIEMLGFNALGVWATLDVNAASNMRIRAIAKLDLAGANEYFLPIKTVGATVISVEDEYYEFNKDEDAKYVLSVETDGLIPYVQLQIQVGTDGGADAEVDRLEITKVWK